MREQKVQNSCSDTDVKAMVAAADARGVRPHLHLYHHDGGGSVPRDAVGALTNGELHSISHRGAGLF